MNRHQFNEYLQAADFVRLFNELGWDRVGNGYDLPIAFDETEYELKAVAQKRGFLIYTCSVDSIPPNSFFRKLDIRLRKYSNDYILIFREITSQGNGAGVHHLWLAPVKTVEKRDLVTIEYASAAQADFLYGKLESLSFDLDEEVTIVDVTTRIHSAFEVNAAKITKEFYSGFKKQHTAFSSFISGITVEGDKQWYVSVMLNRLMFCYFIQKKGFLNFDHDYLRHKLEWTKEQQGENQFFGSFYKQFLRVLFHGGLNSPRHDDDFEQVFGRIPYLNGGLFDEHRLEKQYAGIDIEDKAFEDLFDFFDRWRWHLDTRITATGKDINPDVLGYIFEQYINDRAQMGAYYTKEDITEYIGKNCIIPFLIDQLRIKNYDLRIGDFIKSSELKYIYDAVKKGYTADWKERIPPEIACGIDTTQPNLLERRTNWNRPTTEAFALPTEIWRETVERLQRCEMLAQKIADGEITQINDFITYNFDIRSFVFDLLAETKDHKLILHFYHALQNVSILDPTCGSGAFLFAALNILEPLYEICIDRMEEFHKQNQYLFIVELHEIEQKYRSNIQYFIYKSIILRNLYGVDIMCEATEIAKLRLFLKMVAVVEVDRRTDNLGLDPLPDIDFNIRCGNTLVGYATEADLDKAFVGTLDFDSDKQKIEDQCDIIAKAFERYKEIQLTQGDNAVEFKQAKDELNKRLTEINNELNLLLHKQYAAIPFQKWLDTHQPFHWFAEFYEIVQGNGGFDVIVGNPPYVEYGTKLKTQYVLKNYNTIECGNLHAFVSERTLSYLLSSNGRLGLIIPLPAINTSRMESLQNLIKPKLEKGRSLWVSAYDERPSSLFDGVDQRLIIEIFGNISTQSLLYTTGIKRWYSDIRECVFSCVTYSKQSKDDLNYTKSILKIKNDTIETSILKKFYINNPISFFKSSQMTENAFYYRTAGGRYWKVINDKSSGTQTVSEKVAYLNTINSFQAISLISSSLFWWYYSCHYDMFNLKDYMIFGFKFSDASNNLLERLSLIGREYSKSLGANAEKKIIHSKTKGTVQQKQYVVSKSKPIIDKIDKVLASHYGFTEEELDFIINYDIKYRMGHELNEEE